MNVKDGILTMNLVEIKPLYRGFPRCLYWFASTKKGIMRYVFATCRSRYIRSTSSLGDSWLSTTL